MISAARSLLSRRAFVATAAGLIAAPAHAQPACELGPPDHEKGPIVWRDMDQVELDAAYAQEFYQPHIDRVNSRLGQLSADYRFRRGYPERAAYGGDQTEGLDIYRAGKDGAPVFVFIHGGTWRFLNASLGGFAAEMFNDAGAHFVALDFADVRTFGGDLSRLAAQVRAGIAWVARNAASFGGAPDRLYVGGHSSGGHLCAVALTTDWENAFNLPRDVVKGGLCMSGMYDMAPVRLSWRSRYLAFTDEMEEAMSPQRQLDRIHAPVIVSYGTNETPEFKRQAIDFAAALDAAGRSVELVVASGYHHQETWESLGNPYGPNGRAALAMMGLQKPG